MNKSTEKADQGAKETMTKPKPQQRFSIEEWMNDGDYYKKAFPQFSNYTMDLATLIDPADGDKAHRSELQKTLMILFALLEINASLQSIKQAIEAGNEESKDTNTQLSCIDSTLENHSAVVEQIADSITEIETVLKNRNGNLTPQVTGKIQRMSNAYLRVH